MGRWQLISIQPRFFFLAGKVGVAEALAALRDASARVKNSIVWDFCGEVKCDSVCALWVSAATIWEGTRPSGLEYWTVYCIKKCDLFQLIKPSHPNIMFAGSHLVASDKHTSVRPLTAVLVCSKEMSNNPRKVNMRLYTDRLVSIKFPCYGENGSVKAVLGSIRSDRKRRHKTFQKQSLGPFVASSKFQLFQH